MAENEPRMVFLVRADLKMPEGKVAAQVAHALQLLLFKGAKKEFGCLSVMLTPELSAWFDGSYTKICLKVTSEAELLAKVAQAEALGIPTAVVVDEGRTCFHGVKTMTVAVLGPVPKAIHDPVTQDLKMLR